MKQISITIISILLLTLTCYASEVNGTYWTTFDKYGLDEHYTRLIKSQLVRGIAEGANYAMALEFSVGNTPSKANKHHKYMVKLTTVEHVEALDTFYKDFKNKYVFVADAMVANGMQVSGASNEEVESHLRLARMVGSKIATEKSKK